MTGDRIISFRGFSALRTVLFSFFLLVVAGGSLDAKEQAEQADEYRRSGLRHFYAEQFGEALEAFGSAARIDETLGPDRGSLLADDYRWMGESLFGQERFTQALEHFNRASALYLDQGREAEAAVTLGRSGAVLREAGSLEAAEPLLQRSLVLSERHGLKGTIAECAYDLALLCGESGDRDEQIRFGMQSLRAAEAVHLEYRVYLAADVVGSGLLTLGRPSVALPAFRKALKYAQRYHRYDLKSIQYANLSRTYRVLGRREAAESFALRSLAAAEQIFAPSGALQVREITPEQGRSLLQEARECVRTASGKFTF